jgi:hypothetical protein
MGSNTVYRVCVKTIMKVFYVENTVEQAVVYLKRYVGVVYEL